MTRVSRVKQNNDIIKYDGVMQKGFGFIPKAIMTDEKITIEAKGLLLYMSSYAGQGENAFPSRDKILSDLKIGKDKYYNTLKQLQGLGIVKVDKVREGRYSKNIYTICVGMQKQQEEEKATIFFSGFSDKGYGIVPKIVMQSNFLHLISKAIYGYFMSFTGGSDVCSPRPDDVCYHLGISISTYYKYRKALIDASLIKVTEVKTDGKFTESRIEIVANPSSVNNNKISFTNETTKEPSPLDAVPYTVGRDIEHPCNHSLSEDSPKNDADLPLDAVPYTAVPYTAVPYTVGRDANINSIKNKQTLKINNNKKRECARAYEEDQNHGTFTTAIPNKETFTRKEDIEKILSGKASADVFTYNCDRGSITMPIRELSLLADTYQNVDKLLYRALLSLAQRNKPPKSIYHFVCEMAEDMGWSAAVNEDVISPELKAFEKEQRAIEEKSQKESDEKFEAFMRENGYTDIDAAEKEYIRLCQEKLREKVGLG